MKRSIILLVFFLSSFLIFTPFTLFGFEQTGLASWYGGEFQGRTTANGEIFDTNKMTAAHKTLPFGTVVTITNLNNNKSTEVYINDRGPYIANRVIDLSYAAAMEIDLVEEGTAPVKITAELGIETLTALQTGAFSSKENADRMLETLTAAGFHPVTETTDTGIIRILIPGIHQESLRSVQSQLRQIGIENTIIREDILLESSEWESTFHSSLETAPLNAQQTTIVEPLTKPTEINVQDNNSDEVDISELVRILTELKSGSRSNVEIAAVSVNEIPDPGIQPSADLPEIPTEEISDTPSLSEEISGLSSSDLITEEEPIITEENQPIVVSAPRPPSLPSLSSSNNSSLIPEFFRERRTSASEERGNGTTTSPNFD